MSWNGLVISSFARASKILKAEPESTKYGFPVVNSQVMKATPRLLMSSLTIDFSYPELSLQPEDYLEVADKAASFIRKNLYDEQSHRLQHSYRKGPSKAPAFLDDYAFLISALLDLYENGGAIEWLKWAIKLQEIQASDITTSSIS